MVRKRDKASVVPELKLDRVDPKDIGGAVPKIDSAYNFAEGAPYRWGEPGRSASASTM